MAFIGIDAGTGGIRALVLDGRLRPLARVVVPVAPGRRTPDGGHEIDEPELLGAAGQALVQAAALAEAPIAAVAVAGTAGTLCFRDGGGSIAAPAVAYDDSRFGTGLARVRAWLGRIPEAVRVVPIADAVLEALGADPGGTDWNNALRLGWDPRTLAWPAGASALSARGSLPEPVPPGAPAGRANRPGPLRGALLVRGTTDGCAMQLAAGALADGDWAISLGTTLVWKATVHGAAAPIAPLPGAHVHRVRSDLWLPGAAGNSGGGVLTALEPGADLARRDAAAAPPSGYACYPLARPGERFPVHDPVFRGFGVPGAGDPELHAALLEGVAFVVRLGVERLVAAGVPHPRRIRATGGGAGSSIWMRVLAGVLGQEVIAAPRTEPALGAALLAAAASLGARPGSLDPGPAVGDQNLVHPPDPELGRALAPAYRRFLAGVAAAEAG